MGSTVEEDFRGGNSIKSSQPNETCPENVSVAPRAEATEWHNMPVSQFMIFGL
jgi:hypothetical protein